jgi:hypothetical protein
MAGMIRMNPLRASMSAFKPAMGDKMPGLTAGLGGSHFSQPSFIQAGHNRSKMPHSKAHPGFAALVKRGVPAGALANTSRNASAAAKRANPRLKRVK